MKTSRNPAPSASANPDIHADWLELRALEAADHNSSIQDLVQVIRRSGTTDALEGVEDVESAVDRGSEKSQAVAEDAFAEIEDRLSSCGGSRGAYPFLVNSHNIQLREILSPSYVFMLLLSKFGKDAGPRGLDGAKLFEEVSLDAATSYFGGAACEIGTYHFGTPRRAPNPTKFVSALNEFCRSLGEGVACRQERPNLADQKDAKLDLAVWRPFCDGRHGKLIGFGQCATGNNWPDKLGELLPQTFCAMWMQDLPTVLPIRLFFVPFRVDKRNWMYCSHQGGIIFDRCRIAFHTTIISDSVKKHCVEWIDFVQRKYIKR